MSDRRLSPPLSSGEGLPAAIERQIDKLYCVLHREGRQRTGAACFYFEEEPGRRSAAKVLTRDEARRLAVNFGKLAEPACAGRFQEAIQT